MTEETYKITGWIIYVGYVEITPGFHVQLTRWPNAFHRFMTRLLLGWKWVKTEDRIHD